MILAGILLYENNLFSQNVQVKPPRQTSLEAFSSGDFETAFHGFSELLITYPKDPLYKYYSGVCLVKLERDPEQAVSYLRESMQGSAVVRTIPSDALFWLGRAQQLSGKYAEAIASYNSFAEQSGKKAARDLSVPEFIQACNDKKGQILASVNVPEVPEGKIVTEVRPSYNKESREGIYSGKNEKNSTSKEIIPADYERKLTEALEFQYKADSVNKIADELKKNQEKQDYKEKTELKSRITETENLAVSYQKQADKNYDEAQVLVSEPQERKSQTVSNPASLSKQGSIEKKPAEVLSFFKVDAKPSTNINEKIRINPEVPPGLIYRIQVAVFRNAVAPSYFKGITPVYGFKAAGTDKTNYYAGMFRRRADANKALTIVKQKGFKDAFVVSFSGNKVVSSERAAVLEKDWGKKTFVVNTMNRFETTADTVPPALLFRVEVIRSLKPVRDDVLEGMRKLAGNRGLDIETLNDGTAVYLIGKFITFDSAAEYADLLTRNGYREAKVSAWLGKKEIPVETARQLFEKLE